MTLLQELFPFLLAVHIALALSLFLPSLLLPFGLRKRGPSAGRAGRLSRALLLLQSNGTVLIGVGLAVTGALMLLGLGPQVLAQSWLLLALTIYGANLALAFFVQRPASAGSWACAPIRPTRSSRSGACGPAGSVTSVTSWPPRWA